MISDLGFSEKEYWEKIIETNPKINLLKAKLFWFDGLEMDQNICKLVINPSCYFKNNKKILEQGTTIFHLGSKILNFKNADNHYFNFYLQNS